MNKGTFIPPEGGCPECSKPRSILFKNQEPDKESEFMKTFLEKRLTAKESDMVFGFSEYVTHQPDFQRLRICRDFFETRAVYTQWFLDYLKSIGYKNPIYKILEVKPIMFEPCIGCPIRDAVDLKYDRDTVAFRFEKHRPEIYLCIQPDPTLHAENMIDMYIDGPFIKPDWGDYDKE